jgi:XRE family transcriptional regulator, aerobic/anaerobic benzoate catabolism transcriptional regulator
MRPTVEETRTEKESDERDPWLTELGERLRNLRSRRALPRRAVAHGAAISERHLANMEAGIGNASILVLRQIARALECELAEVIGDETTGSPEWLLIRDLLHGRSDAELKRVRVAVAQMLASPSTEARRSCRIALIGLRGAGKSTLGRLLADHLGYSFLEMDREIERVAGCDLSQIHALYGTNAYRRYERRALEDLIQIYPEFVLAAPGGVVSDAANFNLLLSHCFTIWLRASPEEHMSRVIAQGDFRPMSGNDDAMDDLKRILAGRSAFYAKADLTLDSSGMPVSSAFAALLKKLPRASTRTLSEVGAGSGRRKAPKVPSARARRVRRETEST